MNGMTVFHFHRSARSLFWSTDVCSTSCPTSPRGGHPSPTRRQVPGQGDTSNQEGASRCVGVIGRVRGHKVGTIVDGFPKLLPPDTSHYLFIIECL